MPICKKGCTDKTYTGGGKVIGRDSEMQNLFAFGKTMTGLG